MAIIEIESNCKEYESLHPYCLSQGLDPVLNKMLYYSLMEPSLGTAPTSGLHPANFPN